MAIRLATFAIVPVKRFWRAVNPVSKGEPAAWANAAVGTSRRMVMNGRDWQKRRRNFRRQILGRVADVSGILIGTSDGRFPAVMCHTVSPLFGGVQDFLSIVLLV